MTTYINENIGKGKLSDLISKKVSDSFIGAGKFNVVVRDSADLRNDLKEETKIKTLEPIRVAEKQEIVPKVFKDKKIDLYTINKIPFVGKSIDEDQVNEDYLCGAFQDSELKKGAENINSHRIPVTKDI